MTADSALPARAASLAAQVEATWLAAEVETAFHLPGRHDQSTHGRRGASKYHPHDAGWPESSSLLTAREKSLRRAALDLLVDGGTAWHVAHPSYRTGDNLLARDEQEGRGIETPWKWDEADEGFDGDAVALFPDSPDGREEADWLWSDHPDYVLLRVTVPPEGERDQEMRLLDEGYPAAVGAVPSDWIESGEERRGYDPDVLSRP